MICLMICRNLRSNPPGVRGSLAVRCRVLSACAVLSHKENTRPLGSGPKAVRRLLQPTKARAPQLFGGSAFWSSPRALAGVLPATGYIARQPKGRTHPGVFFFGVFFDGFYGDSTGVVADQPSVEAAPSGEPHGYSLSVPPLGKYRPTRLPCLPTLCPGILPLLGRVPPVLGPSTAVKLVTSGHSMRYPLFMRYPARGVCEGLQATVHKPPPAATSLVA